MNPNLTRLQPYPFQKMADLFKGITPPQALNPISLSIGEPRHPTPALITEAIIEHLHGLSRYPVTRGSDNLRQTIADWLTRRFGLSQAIDPFSQVLPVNGTREALFSLAHCVIDSSSNPIVLMPNPFYQIYEGAALLAGAEPYYYNTPKDHQYLPDFSTVPDSIWKRCQLLYLCSPGNPTGAVVEIETMKWLLDMADRYDFVIASDECYSEIYSHESRPPPGLLMACEQSGRTDYNRCIVLHSLSKRSNVPGLRSGFVAGDAAIIEQYLHYRTYHGCAMPPATQDASIVAWKDEIHVLENRKLYREKFTAVIDILSPVLDVTAPAGSFYLWPELPIDDENFTRRLYEQQNVAVMPGSYLSRDTEHGNPGKNHARLALVATQPECVDAATRIRRFIETL